MDGDVWLDLFARVKNTTRYPLEGFAPELTWIDLREEISIGEERKIFAGAIKGQTALKDGDTRTEYDAQVVSFGLVVSYLVDWDAKDENGKSVDVSPTRSADCSRRSITRLRYRAGACRGDPRKKDDASADTDRRADLACCRWLNGWTLDEVRNLPLSDYRTLIALITEEADRLTRERST